jgi:hypothetical protein
MTQETIKDLLSELMVERLENKIFDRLEAHYSQEGDETTTTDIAQRIADAEYQDTDEEDKYHDDE